jgi:hypothetical protein
MSDSSFNNNYDKNYTTNSKRPSTSTKHRNIHKKNLLTVDFTNPNDKLNSPRSKIALLNLGIDVKGLYYLSREEFLIKHPELKNEPVEVKNRYYAHFEEKRKAKIERAIKKREELLYDPISPKSLSTERINPGDPISMKREQDQLEMMKKQNLSEIKNLIDFEINLNKRRSANEKKIMLQQEKENKRMEEKERERQDKAKEEKELEEKRNEQMRQDQIKQTKEYKQYFLNQMKEFQKEKENMLLQQKLNLKRQMEAQQKDQAFRDKLEQNYQNQRKALEQKQKILDQKNEERRKQIEHRKLITSQKLQQEQLERERKSSNAKRKKEELIQSKYDKYLQKQENIQQTQKEQQKRKEKEMKELQKLRNEKELKNERTRLMNNERLELRKQTLLNHFRISNEKIENQKKRNKQTLNDRLLENQIRTIDKNEKIKETEDQLKYKNYLKLKEIESKQKRAEELLRRKEEMALKKMRLQEEMKLRKDDMLTRVNRLLASGKFIEKEDIYQRIFTKEDMNILKISHSKTKDNFYGGNSTRTGSGKWLSNSKSQSDFHNTGSNVFVTNSLDCLGKVNKRKPETPSHRSEYINDNDN